MLFLIITLLILILYYAYNINYKTLKYNSMVYWTNFKTRIKQNGPSIYMKLEKINSFLEHLILILNDNMLLRELVVSNRISMRFFTLLLSVLQTINSVVISLLNYLKKKKNN